MQIAEAVRRVNQGKSAPTTMGKERGHGSPAAGAGNFQHSAAVVPDMSDPNAAAAPGVDQIGSDFRQRISSVRTRNGMHQLFFRLFLDPICEAADLITSRLILPPGNSS
jgi:hypothetical protein